MDRNARTESLVNYHVYRANGEHDTAQQMLKQYLDIDPIEDIEVPVKDTLANGRINMFGQAQIVGAYMEDLRTYRDSKIFSRTRQAIVDNDLSGQQTYQQLSAAVQTIVPFSGLGA